MRNKLDIKSASKAGENFNYLGKYVDVKTGRSTQVDVLYFVETHESLLWMLKVVLRRRRLFLAMKLKFYFLFVTFQRKHKEVIPFMTYLAFMTITSFLFIIKWTTSAIIFGILTGLFYGYFLLCVGAMYEIFLHEHNQKQRTVNYFVENQDNFDVRVPVSDTSDGISTRSEAGSRKLSC